MKNYQRAIWTAYVHTSTPWRQAVEVFKFAPRAAKIVFVLSAFSFVATLAVHLTIWRPAFIGTLTFEAILVLGMLIAKERFLRVEFGEFENRSGPPDTQDGSEPRYLMLRSELNKTSLTPSHIDDYLAVLEAQIEKESAPHRMADKVTALITGITIGLAAAIFRALSAEALLTAVVVVAGVAFFTKMVISLFPSKLQKLYELKYFMAIYKGQLQAGET